MRMIANRLRNTMPASAGLACLAIVVACVAGCSPIPRTHVEPSPPPVVVVASPVASDFMISAGMLDTWNAVGQVLVRVEGVTYEGRAQMLGLYDIRYRGERFLVMTRAMVVNSQGQGMSTRVAVVLQNGKPDDSAAAIDLLDLLQTRLPAELRKIAEGKSKVRKR